MSFEGPIGGVFLSGYAPVPQYAFPTLDAAMAAAAAAPCPVGGITREPNGFFTLRAGNQPCPSPSGEVSWLYSPFAFYPEAFLGGYCQSGGQYQFYSLNEAKAMALRLYDCAGITFEPNSNMYTLRQNGSVQRSPSGEASWLKVAPGAAGALPQPFAATPARRHHSAPNWSRPHYGQFLSGHCKSGGQYLFATLHDAMMMAARLPDCGGITLNGNTYELRQGTTLCQSPSGETSWLKY
eukprot:m51a1_g201 hypothetical protein (238) ;mRNA; f:661430-662368